MYDLADPPRLAQVARGRIRVLVVEDDFYTRLGAVAFLRGQRDIHVVGAAPDGERALEALLGLQPDVVVIDLRQPRTAGPALAAAVKGCMPAARTLVLTHYLGDEDIARALASGALGYVPRQSSAQQLVEAIRTVHDGAPYLSPEIEARMCSRAARPRLTGRERQVLERVAEGASNKEIAQALEISVRTVAVYVGNILAKLSASSRTHAVCIAAARGLLVRPAP